MKKNKLGRSDLEVSAISMGCWALAGDFTWGEQDEAESIATVHAALDHGINFFDTAEGYGNGRSEEVLGKALKGRRQDAIIATKVSSSNVSPDKLRQSCEGSLRRLNTDYIDVYYIHWPNREVPFAETLETLEQLKQEGKIRVAACSNFGPKDLAELLAVGRVEANQLAYNLLFRAIEYEIQPACAENEISITCYSPLAQGLLTGKFRSADEVPEGRARTRHFSSKRPYTRHGEDGAEEETFAAIAEIRRICEKYGVDMGQASLAWLLEQKAVASVIVGARTPEQAIHNAKAGSLNLPPEMVEELAAATNDLKAKLGTNADMWEAAERSRIR